MTFQDTLSYRNNTKLRKKIDDEIFQIQINESDQLNESVMNINLVAMSHIQKENLSFLSTTFLLLLIIFNKCRK